MEVKHAIIKLKIKSLLQENSKKVKVQVLFLSKTMIRKCGETDRKREFWQTQSYS